MTAYDIERDDRNERAARAMLYNNANHYADNNDFWLYQHEDDEDLWKDELDEEVLEALAKIDKEISF